MPTTIAAATGTAMAAANHNAATRAKTKRPMVAACDSVAPLTGGRTSLTGVG